MRLVRRHTLEMHGYCGTATYLVWRNIRRRCCNPNNAGFKNYGGRGITVCPEWRDSFIAFLRDMGEKPEGMQIDRINNDKGYSSDNCRWVSRLVNMKNRRSSREYEYNGKSLPLLEWSEITGIPYHILRSRIEEGKWDMKRAFTEPVGISLNLKKQQKEIK